MQYEIHKTVGKLYFVFMSYMFTIITITYQNLEGLKKTAASIKEQTCHDYQWLVIDGDSDDGTKMFLESDLASICEWVSEPDFGLYDAMNKGIDRATGRYVVFMNAGDQFADTTIISTVKSAINHSVEIVDFLYGDSIEQTYYKLARSHEQREWGMFTHHQSMFYRGEILKAFRYDLNYRISADYHLTCRMLEHVKYVKYIHRAICNFEPGGLSQQSKTIGRKEQYKIRKDLKLCSALKNIWIYGIQMIFAILRQACPSIYWHLKHILKFISKG